jgi:predicted HicB family RNase H-like nuclease
MKKKNKELKSLDYYFNFPWQFEFETATEGGYAARVKGLSCYSGGQTLEEAQKMIKEALRFHLEGMLEDGIEPQVIDEDACTGKLNIRTSKSLHLKLVQKAKEEDVSVSHLVNDAIIKLYG